MNLKLYILVTVLDMELEEHVEYEDLEYEEIEDPETGCRCMNGCYSCLGMSPRDFM